MVELKALFCAILLATLMVSGPSDAQDDPNLLIGDAINRYTEAVSVEGEQRRELLIEVEAILTQIETEFPDSIPAKFIKNGTALGPIDRDFIAAELRDPFFNLPDETKAAIKSVVASACQEIDCGDVFLSALSQYFIESALIEKTPEFLQAVDAEKFKWLFSNPGAFDKPIDRVNAFSELVDNQAFLQDLDDRLGTFVRPEVEKHLAADTAKSLLLDVAISLITGVATEVTANWLESEGNLDEAKLARTLMQPSVNIGKLLLTAGEQSLVSSGAGATVIWAKNAVALVELGQKSIHAEATGATKEQQLQLLANTIYSLQFSLATREVTGPIFSAESQGMEVNERMAMAFEQNLQQAYARQIEWVSGDEVIYLDSFKHIVALAVSAAELWGRVLEAIPKVNPGQSSGTEHANSTSAFPAGTDAPPVVFETSTSKQPEPIGDQVNAFKSLPVGKYAVSPEFCDPEAMGLTDNTFQYFSTIEKPDFLGRQLISVFYDSVCEVDELRQDARSVRISLKCNAEGNVIERSVNYRILSPTSYIYLQNSNEQAVFTHCKENSSVRTNKGDVAKTQSTVTGNTAILKPLNQFQNKEQSATRAKASGSRCNASASDFSEKSGMSFAVLDNMKKAMRREIELVEGRARKAPSRAICDLYDRFRAEDIPVQFVAMVAESMLSVPAVSFGRNGQISIGEFRSGFFAELSNALLAAGAEDEAVAVSQIVTSKLLQEFDNMYYANMMQMGNPRFGSQDSIEEMALEIRISRFQKEKAGMDTHVESFFRGDAEAPMSWATTAWEYDRTRFADHMSLPRALVLIGVKETDLDKGADVYDGMPVRYFRFTQPRYRAIAEEMLADRNSEQVAPVTITCLFPVDQTPDFSSFAVQISATLVRDTPNEIVLECSLKD